MVIRVDDIDYLLIRQPGDLVSPVASLVGYHGGIDEDHTFTGDHEANVAPSITSLCVYALRDLLHLDFHLTQ
jgi:hypothetical protein